MKKQLPNSVAILVLGICSIVFSGAFLGFILGIIGVVLSKDGRTMYKQDPEAYSDYSTLNAGYIMSIIGIILSVLSIIALILIFVFVGFIGLAESMDNLEQATLIFSSISMT